MVHIIGAGPTGLTVAWNLIKRGQKVTIYDKKEGPGGSWWEPPTLERDLHSHRSVFKGTWMNTRKLFSEMGLSWDDYFGSPYSEPENVMNYIEIGDLPQLVRVFWERSKNHTVKEVCQGLGPKIQDFIQKLTLKIDGLPWDRMTSYELFETLDQVGWDIPFRQTQKVSGAVMNRDMENALKNVGAVFIYNKEVLKINYDLGGCMFSDGSEIPKGERIILCVDNGPARWLIGDNWGPDARSKLEFGLYEAINILFYYDEPVEDFQTTTLVVPELIEPTVLSCVILNVDGVRTIPPNQLVSLVHDHIQVKQPVKATKICWGADWVNGQWKTSQTSSGWNPKPLPFFGSSSKVAMVGMMSPRRTPYASLEAAVEVANSFTGDEVLGPTKLSQLVGLLGILILSISFSKTFV